MLVFRKILRMYWINAHSMVSNVMLSFPVGDAIGTMSIPRNQTFKNTTFIFLLFLRFTIILFSKKKEGPST